MLSQDDKQRFIDTKYNNSVNTLIIIYVGLFVLKINFFINEPSAIILYILFILLIISLKISKNNIILLIVTFIQIYFLTTSIKDGINGLFHIIIIVLLLLGSFSAIIAIINIHKSNKLQNDAIK